MSQPWDRQEGETTRQFARFERYRALGPGRTLEAIYRAETGRKRAAPGRWRAEAARWSWRERAEAWDAEQVRRAREMEQEELDERRRAWISQAMELQSKAVARLLTLDPAGMTFRDVLAALSEGMKLELLARQPSTLASVSS